METKKLNLKTVGVSTAIAILVSLGIVATQLNSTSVQIGKAQFATLKNDLSAKCIGNKEMTWDEFTLFWSSIVPQTIEENGGKLKIANMVDQRDICKEIIKL